MNYTSECKFVSGICFINVWGEGVGQKPTFGLLTNYRGLACYRIVLV